MKLSRELNIKLNWVLNELVPPYIRDRRWFGWLITRALFKDKAPIYMAFNARVYDMSDAEFVEAYREIQSTGLNRPTDLNDACVARILAETVGDSVLEVGCGRGFLSDKLSWRHTVTACDVALAAGIQEKFPRVTFIETPAEKLPFPDDAFETVISTHMLEHVRDLQGVLAELRRVTKTRLIIVVPSERAHLYTPSLHIHFFPYRYSLLLALRPRAGTYHAEKLGGDWFYFENK
jgi:ubiquinone/menaquinone biosynthesis C-methylase UbiE